MKRTKHNRISRRSLLAGAGAAAAGLTILPRFGWSAEEAKLNFYNWDTYIARPRSTTSRRPPASR